MFQQCDEQFVHLLQQCPFPQSDVTVIYKQCYLPTVSYPLPATSIPTAQLFKLQSQAMTVFLQKMGYPQIFPQVAAYAASNCSSIGFRHLGHEQGIQKCLQVLKHIQTNTSMGKIFLITLQHYQLLPSLSQSVLQDTRPLPWSPTPWINNLWSLLHSIDGQILLSQPWLMPPCHQHDSFIMEDVWAYNLPWKQAIQIQSVHLFLCINLLSEITDHSSTHILTIMLYPAPMHTMTNTLQNTSTLQWPHQQCPGPVAWKQW